MQNGASTRVAVVSGTSSGIGLSVAETFMERGYLVVGLSRRGNEALARRPGYIDRRVDLRSPDSASSALETVPEVAKHGIKAVVLNAGHSPAEVNLTKADWDEVAAIYTTNVATALHLVQASSDGLRRAGGGSFTFVGASLANGYKPDRFAYAASKAALTTLMRSCSVEFADHGVISNEVRPGPVATEMTMPGAGNGVRDDVLYALNRGFGIDWLKSSRTVAEWITDIAEFPSNGPTGQIFNFSRKVL